jgi:hypothetical protein
MVGLRRTFTLLPESLRELIGGAQRTVRRLSSTVVDAVNVRRDVGVTDYAFYDRLRKCKARGLELSGLLVKPLTSKIASWVIGTVPTFEVKDEAEATAQLQAWWTSNHPLVLKTYQDALDLADAYLVINADLSVTAVPPSAVRPIVDEQTYSRVIGWRIDQIYPHPTRPGDEIRIVDEYTAVNRVQTITKGGVQQSRRTFPNLIGRVPVVHIPNLRAADELFGHSEAEALIPLLHKYGEVLESAFGGNKRQGRPTPAIEGFESLADIDSFWSQYSNKRTVTAPDGTTETITEVAFDPDKLLTLGKTATFNWKSPAPFMGDTTALLQLFFYLYVQHSELPEWVLGNAIASSMASANTQVEPLVKFIEMKRSMATGWVKELCLIVNAYQSVIDSKVKQVEVDDIAIGWSDLTRQDGQLTLSAVQFARQDGMIDRETGLKLLPLEIDNPAEAVQKAEAEAQARQQQFQNNIDQRFQQAAQTPDTTQPQDGQQPQQNDGVKQPENTGQLSAAA